MLINNNFPNAVVALQPNEEAPIEESSQEKNADINLFYRNPMTKDYKQDENNLKKK